MIENFIKLQALDFMFIEIPDKIDNKIKIFEDGCKDPLDGFNLDGWTVSEPYQNYSANSLLQLYEDLVYLQERAIILKEIKWKIWT